MSPVKIVTDSACAVPDELRESLNIDVVPLSITFGDENYKDGTEISRADFYEKLDGEEVPHTSQPAPGDFLSAFQKAISSGLDVVSILISSKVSGTVNVASMVADTLRPAKIAVIDSKAVSVASALVVEAAARAAALGRSCEEIVDMVLRLRDHAGAFIMVPSVRHLKKSGRISKGKALLAGLLSIRPILELRDGSIDAIDRVRSVSGALDRVLELTAEKIGAARSFRLAVAHSNALEQAREFASVVKRRFNIDDVLVADVGPAIACHGGPGMIGVVSLTYD